jgi:hypothetical protein
LSEANLSSEFEEIARFVQKTSRGFMLQGQEPAPTAFVLDKGSHMTVVGLAIHKDEWSRALSKIIREQKSDAFFLIAPAWMRTMEKGKKKWDGIMPSDSPDRQEIAMLTLFRRKEPTVQWHCPYDTTTKGTVMNVGEWKLMADGTKVVVESRWDSVWEEA